MNFAQMLSTPVRPLFSEEDKKPTRGNPAASARTLQNRIEKQYREAFRAFDWIATGRNIASIIGVQDGGREKECAEAALALAGVMQAMPSNATSHRSAACGASGGLPGCTSAAATEDK